MFLYVSLAPAVFFLLLFSFEREPIFSALFFLSPICSWTFLPQLFSSSAPRDRRHYPASTLPTIRASARRPVTPSPPSAHLPASCWVLLPPNYAGALSKLPAPFLLQIYWPPSTPLLTNRRVIVATGSSPSSKLLLLPPKPGQLCSRCRRSQVPTKKRTCPQWRPRQYYRFL